VEVAAVRSHPCADISGLARFFLDIYTARAHNDGTVEQIIEEVLAFPHKQSTEDLQRYLDAFLDHDTSDRLPQITAPTLVLAGGRDSTSRPEVCRSVAELIPGARFEVMEEECHQPFQEVPGDWNARVKGFGATSSAPPKVPSERRARRPSPA
jgi:pimeloyl-ACP methyl ester carboxylesterase